MNEMTKQHNEMLKMIQENENVYHCLLVSSLLNFLLIIILIFFLNRYYHDLDKEYIYNYNIPNEWVWIKVWQISSGICTCSHSQHLPPQVRLLHCSVWETNRVSLRRKIRRWVQYKTVGVQYLFPLWCGFRGFRGRGLQRFGNFCNVKYGRAHLDVCRSLYMFIFFLRVLFAKMDAWYRF